MKKQQFNPGLLGVFTNPFYHMRRQLYKSVSSFSMQLSGKILDIGCGSKPYQNLFTGATEYIGIDYDSPANRAHTKADVFYDGEHFPFKDGSFDSAIATEVLEHVFNPDIFLKESLRVLKDGGVLLLTCPFAWDEHSQPYDYARYSSFGLAHLMRKNGFEIMAQQKTAGNMKALCQILNCYIYKILPFKNYRLRVCCYLFTTAPITILGSILSLLLPQNPDYYLSNVIIVRKPN